MYLYNNINIKAEGKMLGTSSEYLTYVYGYYLRYKDLDSFDHHDDISLMKNVKEKKVKSQIIDKYIEVNGKHGKEKKPVFKEVEKYVWDIDTMPEETKSEEFYDAGAVQGFLIGTVKQLIGEVEDLKKRISLLKVK
jgi:hypothetical protein